MKKKTQLDSVSATLTSAEWEGKIESWKESTSTSPSGFHLSHSKALVASHGFDVKTPQGVEFEQKCLQLIS